MQNKNEAVPQWLRWAREIQSLAQTGSAFAENDWQILRYDRLQVIAAEISAAHSDRGEEYFIHQFKNEHGYATPKVDVRAASFLDGKLLMVREISDGGWTLPGGWADIGDVPSEAAEREAWEESGFRVKSVKLIGVYDANRTVPMDFFHAYKLVFLCKIIDGKAQPSTETSEVSFFDNESIPENLSSSRTPPRVIEDCFNTYADQSVATIFD